MARTGSDDTTEIPGPSLDDRPGLGGVSEIQRRNTIVSLVDQRPHLPFTIGELTVALSDWFGDETEGMVPTDEEIHSVLYDFDLPHLDDANRLVFDQETGRVFSSDTRDASVPNALGDDTVEPTSQHTASTGDADATNRPLSNGNVPVDRVVELGMLLFGVAGVALAVSSVSPFGTSYALVPPALVVLFFGYRAVTRR